MQIAQKAHKTAVFGLLVSSNVSDVTEHGPMEVAIVSLWLTVASHLYCAPALELCSNETNYKQKRSTFSKKRKKKKKMQWLQYKDREKN